MEADIAVLSRCRTKEIDLLRSGNFSDVVVICGDREWKCHRAILTTRSIWFRKALAGPFEEATTGRVTLYEKDPDCVDLALTHIYGLELDVTSQIPDKHFVVQSVSLWRTADFLQLTSLKLFVEKAVASYCDERMKHLCTDGNEFKWSRRNADDELSWWALDLVVGTLDAYKWQTLELKDILMEFIWVGKKYTLDPASTILGHFKDTPDFVEDLLGSYATGHWLRSPRWAAFDKTEIQDYWNNKVRACARCGKEIFQPTTKERQGQVKNPFKLEGHTKNEAGWCSGCSKLNMIPWRDRVLVKEENQEV